MTSPQKLIPAEQLERIKTIQQEMQAKYKLTGAIHLVGKNDRIFSVMIPATLLALSVPMIGYGIYKISTENATNN